MSDTTQQIAGAVLLGLSGGFLFWLALLAERLARALERIADALEKKP